MVFTKDTAQVVQIAAYLEGNLTGSIYSHTQGKDDEIYAQVEPILRQNVGRLINDQMPTGVAVVPSMNHGGPFPASLLGFAALRCYDNVRPHRLPPETEDKNPIGKMWRSIDGEWTQGVLVT